jgi:poly(A) polymerase
MKMSKLKTILVHPGIRELLALHRADADASGRDTDHVEYCEQLLSQWTEADLNPQPLVTGHDLLQRGLEPGPLFTDLLAQIREAQLEGKIRSSEEAMQLLEQILRERSPLIP